MSDRLGALVLRADASPQIGLGHVARSTSIASAWIDRGGTASLLSGPAAGPAMDLFDPGGRVRRVTLAAEPGSETDALETVALAASTSAEWVIADGYAFDEPWDEAVGAGDSALLLVDDFGDRRRRADIVLNPNGYAAPAAYEAPTLLRGLPYVLLRPDFAQRLASLPDDGARSEVLVSFGGTDPGGVGASLAEALGRQLGNHPVRLTDGASDMVECLGRARVVVVAAGSTLWECLCSGVLPLSAHRHDLQRQVVEGLARDSLAVDLGPIERLQAGDVAAALSAALEDDALLAHVAATGPSTIDGLGASRVVTAMVEGGPSRG